MYQSNQRTTFWRLPVGVPSMPDHGRCCIFCDTRHFLPALFVFDSVSVKEAAISVAYPSCINDTQLVPLLLVPGLRRAFAKSAQYVIEIAVLAQSDAFLRSTFGVSGQPVGAHPVIQGGLDVSELGAVAALLKSALLKSTLQVGDIRAPLGGQRVTGAHGVTERI